MRYLCKFIIFCIDSDLRYEESRFYIEGDGWYLNLFFFHKKAINPQIDGLIIPTKTRIEAMQWLWRCRKETNSIVSKFKAKYKTTI